MKLEQSLLSVAINYLERGLSIIPITAKKPAHKLKWNPYQDRLPTEGELRDWFSRDGVTGLAVILGPVSGGLYCRDFDQSGAYELWAANHAEHAPELPTVKTARGHHVYFRCKEVTKTKKLRDGELRGVGSYCVLPPSVHPNGIHYSWVVPLPAKCVPFLDPQRLGLEKISPLFTECTESTQAVSVLSAGSVHSVKSGALLPAIDTCIPTDVHQNHKCLWNLARAVKAREKEHRKLTIQEREYVFDAWFSGAQPFLRPGQPREEYEEEFMRAYDHVKFALGEGPCDDAFRRAKEGAMPRVALQFEDHQIQLLVAVCRELQRANNKGPFFLSCRKVQSLMTNVSHTRAALWLRILVRKRILEEIEKGGPETNRATRYRYLLPLED